MKIAARTLAAMALIGAVLLVGLLFLGKKSEIKISLKGTPQQESPQPLPSNLALPEKQNYTDLAAKEVADQIIEKNQEGPLKQGDGLALILNPTKVLEAMAISAMAAREKEAFTFSEKDLNIVADSKDASKAYLDSLQSVINTTIGDYQKENLLVLAQQAILGGDVQGLANFVTRSDQALNKLQKLPVPLSWVKFHKEVILTTAEARGLARDFAVWQDDPLRALLALESYKTFEQKLQSLLNEFAQRAKAEGLL